MFKHLLIPTDGSDLSKAAVRKGIDFAKSIGAAVTQITVDEPYQIIAVDDPILWVHTQEQYMEATKKRAQQILKAGEEYAQSKGVKIVSLHEYHPVIYQGIVEAAKKAGSDLISMASHGRRGILALVLGSTTYRVLTHATIPVLVWRG
jgi:nucleotide-binding universal stress UspA family protein